MLTINNIQYLATYLNKRTLFHLYELTNNIEILKIIKKKYGHIPVSLLTYLNKGEHLIIFPKSVSVYINHQDIIIYSNNQQIHLKCENDQLVLVYLCLSNIKKTKHILKLIYSYFIELIKKEYSVIKKDRTIQIKNDVLILPEYVKCTAFHNGTCISI
jgi:hypothetical protein